jgi:Uri superfamily endonuclease
MKGSYVLLLELSEKQEIVIGKLGSVVFAPGFYAYVGSAMNGLEPRLSRHLRRDKRLHWHIDYLLEKASITTVILSEGAKRTECALAQALAQGLDPVPGFGCSDCRCSSHLYFSPERSRLIAEAVEAFYEAGLPFQVWSASLDIGELRKPS